MRPNVDLPWSVHGRVKDYAGEHEVTLTDAYEQLLTRGLRGEKTVGVLREEVERTRQHVENDNRPMYHAGMRGGLSFALANLTDSESHEPEPCESDVETTQ